MNPATDPQARKEFWNSRAHLGLQAGTQDVIAKQLEVEAIAGQVSNGMNVLDIGCGNGITAIELARRHSVHVTGMDNAEKMVEAAQELSKKATLKGQTEFRVGDITQLPTDLKQYDIVYTERTLINLPDTAAQAKAIRNIAKLLIPGGRYLMCENSAEGLRRINEFRAQLGLKIIETPWHNCYIDDESMQQLSSPGLTLERVLDFSSTYYFLSRIVNAHLASLKGEEPKYDDPINALALKLPAMMDGLGQTKIWIWRSR
ncbi:MAG: class I SAM-dependent methyltransferase [Candidatus Peribacter sp.]|nr:class I SAM-dependent methyltransferase [Candidatus Peribacter sp.]